jgi:hypothetical protein
MTTKELARLIDCRGYMLHLGFQVDVITLDARVRFGTVDVLVTPVSGSGEVWVEASRVKLSAMVTA